MLHLNANQKTSEAPINMHEDQKMITPENKFFRNIIFNSLAK